MEEVVSEIEEEDSLGASKISIMIQEYQDIFSDFDPRPYTERALSDDLLLEIKRAEKVKTADSIELVFSIPKKIRDVYLEALIKKRLREYFKKHHLIIKKEIGKIKKKGLFLTIAGALIGIIATLISIWAIPTLIKNMFLILLEPASWFTIWNGLEHIFFISSSKEP